jgi:DNA-binding transcriptional LysR family regulator
MNLRQLDVFQAVMQTGNMSAAARLLHITPSAVSKTVAHTELQLGYPLFTRSQGSLTPTPEARVLFEESAQVHRQLDALRQIAQNLGRVDHGAVRLAAIPSVTHEFLPLVLQRHAARYPRVDVEVRTLHQDQMASALLSRSVDFGLGYYEHAHPQIASDLLVSGRLFLAVGREIWQRATRVRHGNPYGYFAKVPLIRLVGDDPMRPLLDELAEKLGLQAQVGNIQVQTSRLAVELVRRGMGWTLVDFLTAHQLDPASVVAMELHDVPPISLYAYHAHTSPPGQQARHMLDMLPAMLHEALSATHRIPPGG